MALDRPTTLRIHPYSPAVGGSDLFFEDDPVRVDAPPWRCPPVVLPVPDAVIDAAPVATQAQVQQVAQQIEQVIGMIDRLQTEFHAYVAAARVPTPSWWSRLWEALRRFLRI